MAQVNFKSFKQFLKYVKTLDSGIYRVCSFHGEVEYWLLDVENMRVRIVYDNYSSMNDIATTNVYNFEFIHFKDFANSDFYDNIEEIKEI